MQVFELVAVDKKCRGEGYTVLYSSMEKAQEGMQKEIKAYTEYKDKIYDCPFVYTIETREVK